MVANPRAMLYYRLEPWEGRALLPLMDGTRTVGDIVVERLEEEGELDAAGATQLVQSWSSAASWNRCRRVLEKGLERGARSPDTSRTQDPDLPEDAVDRLGRGPSGFVRWWYRTLLRPFFRPVGAVVAVLVAASRPDRLRDDRRIRHIHPRLALGAGGIADPIWPWDSC